MITVLKIIGYREEPEFIQIRQFETIEVAQEYIKNNDKQGKYYHKCFIVSNCDEIDLQTLKKGVIK